MKHHSTYERTKLLDKTMKIYLNRKHITIRMTPLEAEKDENEPIVRQTYLKRYLKAVKKKRNPKFGVGDNVRIFKERGTFN